VNDRYVSLTLTNGSILRLPIFFDRAEIKNVDVFQIWLMNLKPLASWTTRLLIRLRSLLAGVRYYIGYFDVYLDSKKIRRQYVGAGLPPDWGTNVILNFDDSEIALREHVVFELRYYGYRLFVKSLELYSVVSTQP
jgi:hypothetical protein